MATTTSLTGRTVRVTNLKLVGGGGQWVVPTFEAEVLATCFNLRNQVEAVEIHVPGQGRVTVFKGYEVLA